MKTVKIRCSKSGNVYEFEELTALEASDAFALAGGGPMRIHFETALSLRHLNGELFPSFYNPRNDLPQAIAINHEIEKLPESDLDRVATRYAREFALKPEERDVQRHSGEGGVVRVHSARHGHDYEFRELNWKRSGEAFQMSAGAGNSLFYRMAFALKRTNGADVPWLTSNRVMRDVLARIPLVDMQLIAHHYEAEFESAESEEDDLGNELESSDSSPGSSTSDAQQSMLPV